MTDQSDILDPLLAQARLIISCGPGGVGKTTTAAALALRAAQQGRRALVLTIDPARRLATCLGLDQLGWQPTRVQAATPGDLWAMMLDTRQAFDDLIRRLAPDDQTAARVMQSRLYGIFAGSMHGTPEYMALESLHTVYFDERFDLIVLDTPPLTDALNFFKVPNRASWMFDERIMRWFVPGKARSGLFGRLHPGNVTLKLLRALAGSSLVDDISEFFSALDVIGEALKQRGDDIAGVLRDPATAYIVITAPDPRRITEALDLAAQLGELDQTVRLFVVNRSHHDYANDSERPGPAGHDAKALLSDRLVALLEQVDPGNGAADAVLALHRQMVASGNRHRDQIEHLATLVGADRVCAIPDFEEDVHDLGRLADLAAALRAG